MLKRRNTTYSRSGVTTSWSYPNYWDVVALLLVLAVLVLLGWGAKQMAAPYELGEPIAISLDPAYLPYYALRTVLRMFIALGCSLLFTFIVGAWAAKSPRAERIIIPVIDVLQSVPVLGFLAITVSLFIALFPGSLLGPECAAIFTIFTAQVWNITLSFYQSLKTVPSDLKEAADMFHLSNWQRFWRIEVPFAMPGLLWNSMMSMSASWVFLVVSEAITVANHKITLPGIGSYIALAIARADKSAIAYVIIAMFIVIFIYYHLLFRPLLAWAEKFKFEESEDESVSESWLVNLFMRTRWLWRFGQHLLILWDAFVNFPLLNRKRVYRSKNVPRNIQRGVDWLWNGVIFVIVAAAAYFLGRFLYFSTTLVEIEHVFFLGAVTLLRVIVLIIISSLIWVPIGVWIGRHPRVANISQPIIQFLAAFPAVLLFPIVTMAIVKYHLNVNIWVSPLMILGTQWYILFNVIAGASVLPKDLYQATNNLGVKGWLWWRRLVLPGIFPYYVTGAITAAGGAWNISIVAEAVSWGNTHLWATGLGAFITRYATVGNFPKLALGIVVMCIYVLVMNRVVWRPLYRLAEQRFQLG